MTTTRTRTLLDATDTDVEAFRAHVEAQERARYVHDYGEESTVGVHSKSWPCTLVVRRKYICADVGTSGRYMIDRQTGEVWGIKGYGKVHRSYSYGTVYAPEHWPTTAQYVTGQPIPASKMEAAMEAATKPPAEDPAEVARRSLENDRTTYPELREVASRIADVTCFSINRAVRDVESAMPYKGQFVLEETIKLLQERV